jgi:hypothetical protein
MAGNKEKEMTRFRPWILIAPLLLAACDGGAPASNQVTSIKVRSAEQDRLHTLDALNLAIALKRAIYAAGFTCRRVTDAGFVAPYNNLDMWTASCDDNRQWAIFAGPDGSAQVRDCKDIPGTGLPACAISKKPQGSFDGPQGSTGS